MDLLSQRFCCDEPRISFVQLECFGLKYVELVCGCGHVWRPTTRVMLQSEIQDQVLLEPTKQ